MSTILKALEKNYNSNSVQMITVSNSSNTKWKLMFLMVSCIAILLLSALTFLLFKWGSLVDKNTSEVIYLSKALQSKEQSKENINSIPIQNPIEESSPEVYKEPLIVEYDDKKKSSVSEVYFDTQPLPIPELPKKNTQKWVSADKREKIKPVDNSNKLIKRSAPDTTLEDVPSDLQRRFARAVELEAKGQLESIDRSDVTAENQASMDISKMPIQFQFQVPLMRYDSHVYSSIESDRWIRINGQDLRVGDSIGEVELVDIKPHQSEFSLRGQHFTLESLVDWEG